MYNNIVKCKEVPNYKTSVYGRVTTIGKETTEID